MSVTYVSEGDSATPAYMNTLLNNVSGGIYNVKSYGAVGDGTADDTVAIQLAIDAASANGGGVVDLPLGAYKVTDGLDVPSGVTLRGCAVTTMGGYNKEVEDHPCRIVKTNENTNADYVLKLADNTALYGLAVLGPNANYATPINGTQWLGRAGTYPTDTGNPDYGIILNGQACRIENCIVMYFEEAGIYGSTVDGNNNLTTIARTNVTACKLGVGGTIFDSQFRGSNFSHNAGGGVVITGSYNSFVGVRSEWNGVYGISVSGSHNVVGSGCIIDRNGGPGVRFFDPTGGVIIGAIIRRNGCGGDGTTGRSAASYDQLGGFGYIATADLDSCNVKLEGAQRVIVEGNEIERGFDDTGSGGVDGPAYAIVEVDSATPKTAQNNQIGRNAGVGFNSGYVVGSGSAGYFNDTPPGAFAFGVSGGLHGSQDSSTDALNVSALSAVSCNTASGAVVIGGIVGGVLGQRLTIYKTSLNNTLTIEHDENTGNQDIFCPRATDLVLTGYGGVTLEFNGTNWYVVDSYGVLSNGTATVASGETSVAVTHSLKVTPDLQDISVTPTNNLGTATKFWISTPTATQFTINVDQDPGATTATFAWTASVQ